MAAWTPEEDAAIRARARTHSASQIAAQLPGRSRASVVGRAWRLGESLAKDEATRLELEHPKRRAKLRQAASAPPAMAPAPKSAWPSASPSARRAALAVQPRLVRLEQLTVRQCRWPYGEADVRFCGHGTAAAAVYCQAHRGLALVPDPGGYDAEALAAEIDRRDRRARPTAA
jgi:hypothetical protein